MYPGVPPTDKVYEVITDITRKYRNILGHSFPFWHGPTTAEELWEDSKVPTQLQLKNTWKTAGKSVWKPKRWRSGCLGISHHAFLGGWKLKSKGANVLQKEKAYSMKDKIIKDQLLMNVVISFFSTVLVANSSKKKKASNILCLWFLLATASEKILNVGGRVLKNPEELRAHEDVPCSTLIHWLWQTWLYQKKLSHLIWKWKIVLRCFSHCRWTPGSRRDRQKHK